MDGASTGGSGLTAVGDAEVRKRWHEARASDGAAVALVGGSDAGVPLGGDAEG